MRTSHIERRIAQVEVAFADDHSLRRTMIMNNSRVRYENLTDTTKKLTRES